MFAIKLKGKAEQQFHINDQKPPIVFLDDVLWFYADGDELKHIRKQFDNIPISLWEKCRWTGEMALFVYHNLETDTW
jgi:hypothetical protein